MGWKYILVFKIVRYAGKPVTEDDYLGCHLKELRSNVPYSSLIMSIMTQSVDFLSLVGQEMKNMVGISGGMLSVLGKHNINIEMILQGTVAFLPFFLSVVLNLGSVALIASRSERDQHLLRRGSARRRSRLFIRIVSFSSSKEGTCRRLVHRVPQSLEAGVCVGSFSKSSTCLGWLE